MSGLEAVGIVASVVSAFHEGAELVKMCKERHAKRKQKVNRQPKKLPTWSCKICYSAPWKTARRRSGSSFWTVKGISAGIDKLFPLSNDRARQELLMVAVSMQKEIIDSLGQARRDLEVIVELA